MASMLGFARVPKTPLEKLANLRRNSLGSWPAQMGGLFWGGFFGGFKVHFPVFALPRASHQHGRQISTDAAYKFDGGPVELSCVQLLRLPKL